ncbi:MAG: TonB-dependent receptor plug domain-containing protein [Kordiimonadaceae bacterium]|nr:TonB-dependent receptor plug domain-containing protein [Kordiimonadaceae bacterium]
MRRNLLSSVIIVPCIVLTQLTYADENDNAGSSVVTYEKDYFVKFEPVTLLDMLSRIPGVQEILDKSRREKEQQQSLGTSAGPRGFGSGGDQILINGKRLAGKDNNIDDTLARITAENVEKIDLIRGAAAGLDVQSQGLVINITLKKGTSSSSTFWKVGGRANLGDDLGHTVTLSHSGSSGNLDYTATFESNRNFIIKNRIEDFIYGGSGVISRVQDSHTPNRKDNHKFAGNLTYNFEDGAVLRLNGLYNPETQNEVAPRTMTFLDESYGPAITFTDTALDSDGNRKLSERWTTNGAPTKWEIGGDYSRKLGTVGSLKSLFVFNKENSTINNGYYKGDGASEFLYKNQDAVLSKSENIIRGSITRGIAAGQSVEIGGEAAINKFNRTFQNSTRSTASDPLALKNDDNVKIKENRFEIFANHSYTISPQMSLTSSMTGEFSKIVADNFFANGSIDRREANFKFLKPRMNFRYDLNSQDQLRLTVERTVSQLDFNNFSTSFNPLTEKIDFGNTGIKPMRSWDFTAAIEHRFAQDSGSISLDLFYKKYTDYIDKVDFTEYVDSLGNPITADEYFSLPAAEQTLTSDDFISKSGNVPSAKAIGFKFKSSYRLGIIGLPEAVFSANYDYEKGTLDDPFTGREIRFSYKPSSQINFAYRHDITALQLSYGASVTFRRGFYGNDIRLNWYGTPGTLLEVFVEKNVYNGIKLRVSGKDLTGSLGDSNQFFYDKHLRFNVLDHEVQRHTRGPRVIEATLQGTF